MRVLLVICALAATTGVASAQSYGPSLSPRPGWAPPPDEPRPGWAAPPNAPRPGWAPPPPPQYYTIERPRGPRRCYWIDDLYGSRRVCD